MSEDLGVGELQALIDSLRHTDDERWDAALYDYEQHNVRKTNKIIMDAIIKEISESRNG